MCDEELLTGVCYWLFAMFDPFNWLYHMMFGETLDWNNDMLLIIPNELNNSSREKKLHEYKLSVEGIHLRLFTDSISKANGIGMPVRFLIDAMDYIFPWDQEIKNFINFKVFGLKITLHKEWLVAFRSHFCCKNPQGTIFFHAIIMNLDFFVSHRSKRLFSIGKIYKFLTTLQFFFENFWVRV